MKKQAKSPSEGHKTWPREATDSSSGRKLGRAALSVPEEEFVATPWAYSDIVKEHFLNPKNFLMGDETKYPHDASGLVGNPICGDQMKMFLQIENDHIKDIKWKTYGCASAIASTSALSELAKGKSLDDALKITPDEIADFLGGLPKHKFHCSVLGHEALADAIKNYKEQKCH